MKVIGLFMCVSILCVHSLISSGPATKHKDFPNKCFDPVMYQGFAVGEAWHRYGECSQYFCSRDKHTMTLMVHSNWCSKVRARPPCKIRRGNLTLNFPECCATLKCP